MSCPYTKTINTKAGQEYKAPDPLFFYCSLIHQAEILRKIQNIFMSLKLTSLLPSPVGEGVFPLLAGEG